MKIKGIYMSAFVISLSHEEASVFKLIPTKNGGKPEVTHLKATHHDHHTSHTQDSVANHDKFFANISSHLNGASEILLVGPGLAKTHFKNYLEKHSAELAKAVVGAESADTHHLTENQVLAMARKFFKSYEMFH